MSNIVPIQKPFAPDDVPATLRRIADDIEKGEHGLMTTCLVVLGHTGEGPVENGVKLQKERYELFGCGPRCDAFTVRGLLLTVATRELDGGDE
jgi:hypothetical protein